MCHTAIPAGGFTPVAYIDKLQVWLPRHLTTKEQRQLRKCCGRRLHVYLKEARCRVQLRQPAPEAFRLLEVIGGDACMVNGIELALDLTSHDRRAVDDLRQFIDRALTMPMRKRRRDDRPMSHPLYYFGTLYHDRREAKRNVVVYSDRPSKVNGRHCVHIEWRAKGAARLRDLGIQRPADLIGFDHRAFWQEHLRLYAWDRAAIGTGYCRSTPTYRVGDRPWEGLGYDDRRFGQIIERAASVSQDGASAQSIRQWCRDLRWFKPTRCMVRLAADALLPAAGETWRERHDRRHGPAQAGPRRPKPLAAVTRGLSDALWEQLRQVIPAEVNSHRYGGGRPRRPDRDCLTAIIVVARGATWREVGDWGICPTKTAHDRLKEWQPAGVFRRMKEAGLDRHEELTGVDWSVLGVR